MTSLADMLRNRVDKATALDTPENMDGYDIAADIAAGFVPVVGTAQAARDFERARRDDDGWGMALSGLGLIPFAGGITKTMSKLLRNKPTEFEKAHDIARKNAALPVEQGGLGLPDNNTSTDRAKAMGFDLNNLIYHGTSDEITSIDPKRLGQSTGANSAQNAFWASDNPRVARTYAEYSATDAKVKKLIEQANKAEENNNFDLYDRLLEQAENLESEFSKNYGHGQNLIPLVAKKNNMLKANMNGRSFDDETVGKEVMDLLKASQKYNRPGVEFQDIDDAIGVANLPSTHYGITDLSSVRSPFAAFDPKKRNSNNLLAGTAAGAISLPILINLLRNEEQEQTY